MELSFTSPALFSLCSGTLPICLSPDFHYLFTFQWYRHPPGGGTQPQGWFCWASSGAKSELRTVNWHTQLRIGPLDIKNMYRDRLCGVVRASQDWATFLKEPDKIIKCIKMRYTFCATQYCLQWHSLLGQHLELKCSLRTLLPKAQQSLFLPEIYATSIKWECFFSNIQAWLWLARTGPQLPLFLLRSSGTSLDPIDKKKLK